MTSSLDFRSKLAVPWVFRLFKKSIGAGTAISIFVREHVRPATGNRVLDIGCGLGDVLEHFAGTEVDYLGIDVSEEYIDFARRRYGSKARFVCRSATGTALDEPASFDIAIANGVLHHLGDGEASAMLELARSSLKPAGRLVTLDGCYTGEQSSVERFILSRDRGHFVRTREGYETLARESFPRVETRIRHDLLRIPFTHIIMECSS